MLGGTSTIRAVSGALLAGMLVTAHVFAQDLPASLVPDNLPAAPAAVSAPLTPPPAVIPKPAEILREPEPKRLFVLLPNNRSTWEDNEDAVLTPKQKLQMTTSDSFDRGTFITSAIFASIGQWHRDAPSFGNGIPAYAHYFGASTADFMIGNYMSECLFPVMLHEDPRFFRRGTGSGLSRLRHAVGQIFWTRTDSGGMEFNYSEVIGNATAVAISQSYYPDSRTASQAVFKFAQQIGVDMAGNVIKEFAPELRKAFLPKHHIAPSPPPEPTDP